MADAEEGSAEAEDVPMVESAKRMRTAKLATAITVTVAAAGTRIEPKNGTGVTASNS